MRLHLLLQPTLILMCQKAHRSTVKYFCETTTTCMLRMKKNIYNNHTHRDTSMILVFPNSCQGPVVFNWARLYHLLLLTQSVKSFLP